MKVCPWALNQSLSAMKILRCSFFSNNCISINICFCVVLATTSTFTSVVFWYASISSAGLRKKWLFSFYVVTC